MVEISDHFQAILGCLLGEDWTTPRLAEMVIAPDGHLLGRCDGEAAFKAFLGASADLLKNVHGVAELDGDEIGYLVAKVAEIQFRTIATAFLYRRDGKIGFSLVTCYPVKNGITSVTTTRSWLNSGRGADDHFDDLGFPVHRKGCGSEQVDDSLGLVLTQPLRRCFQVGNVLR